MVSNYDRIYAEITKEAQNLAPKQGINPEEAVVLVMTIVDLVDQHRRNPMQVTKKIKTAILNSSRN